MTDPAENLSPSPELADEAIPPVVSPEDVAQLGEAYRLLSDRQRQFCLAYVRCWSVTGAARQAGYKAPNASGQQLMLSRQVRRALADLMDYCGCTPERVKEALSEIAFGSDLADYEPWLEGAVGLKALRRRGVNTSLIQTATIGKDGQRRLSLYSRLDALTGLTRILGMLAAEKHEHHHSGGVDVNLSGASDADLKRWAHATADDVQAMDRASAQEGATK
jgi:hypothetical protein